MRLKELGNTGIMLPCIGMGTWKLGQNPSEESRAISEGIRLGMRLVDTAEMYHTELLVGEAIRDNAVFVATKVSPHHFRFDDVIKACDRSLKNLGIKSIDLYQLHWPNPQIPIAETMQAMERLVKEGKVRHIGVSNFSIEEIKAAQAALKRETIVSNQIEYSVFVRDVADYLMPFCRNENITILAYSPLGSGAMAKVQSTKIFGLLKEIGEAHGATPSQVALSWLISKDGVIPIPKASSMEHIRENARAADIKLTDKEIEAIDSTNDSGMLPMASKLTGFTRSTTSFWSRIMERRERLRKHGI